MHQAAVSMLLHYCRGSITKQRKYKDLNYINHCSKRNKKVALFCFLSFTLGRFAGLLLAKFKTTQMGGERTPPFSSSGTQFFCDTPPRSAGE